MALFVANPQGSPPPRDIPKPSTPQRTNQSSIKVRPAGLEPATLGLEIPCSIRLSYGREAFLILSPIGVLLPKIGHVKAQKAARKTLRAAALPPIFTVIPRQWLNIAGPERPEQRSAGSRAAYAWNMETPTKTILLAAGLTGLLLPLSGQAVATPPPAVVDDAALARNFVSGLAAIVDQSRTIAPAMAITGQAAATQLAAAEGRQVRLPPSPTLCTLQPEQSLYEAVMPAVVVVGSIYKCNNCSDWHLGGMASGWLLADNGLVVANHHVFGEDSGHRFGVMTADGEVFAVTAILAADRAGDAAIARIDTRGRQLPSLALGQRPACGDAVSVISHPAGRFYSLTRGIVSRFHRRQDDSATGTARPAAVLDLDTQTTAPIWMSVTADFAVGSSGGPVFNADGEVVGMVSRTFSSQAKRNHRRHGQFGTQMVFKDCVSLDTLLKLIDPAG